MNTRQDYSFLNDELAISEIHKHKWLESEKKGEEVGFASAAYDWITNYGESFKLFRIKMHNDEPFSERRRHRRLFYHLPVVVKVGGKEFAAFSQDFNIMGFSCLLPEPLNDGTEASIALDLPKDGILSKYLTFRFESRSLRIYEPRLRSSQLCYAVFFPFAENVRSFLRNTPELFQN